MIFIEFHWFSLIFIDFHWFSFIFIVCFVVTIHYYIRFSAFQISHFQIFRFSDFQIFKFSDFQIFRFSDFRFSDFEILDFQIFIKSENLKSIVSRKLLCRFSCYFTKWSALAVRIVFSFFFGALAAPPAPQAPAAPPFKKVPVTNPLNAPQGPFFFLWFLNVYFDILCRKNIKTSKFCYVVIPWNFGF